MKNKILFVLKLILLVLIFLWIFKSVDLRQTIVVLQKINIYLFLIAFIANNLSNVFLTIKWYRLSVPLNTKSNFIELFKLNYVSIFYSSFLPGQSSGELVKGIKLAKKEGSMQKVWIPIFIDKITNLLIVFIIGFVAVISESNFRQNKTLIMVISASTIFLAILTMILFSEHTEKIERFIKETVIKICKIVKINTKPISDFSISCFEDYKKHDLLMFETLLWSVLVKIPHMFVFYLLALSLNIDLDLIQSAWLFSTISIVTLLPISFSGLGIREGTTILILSQLGIDNASALSLSLLIFILLILMALIGGIIELISVLKSHKHV